MGAAYAGGRVAVIGGEGTTAASDCPDLRHPERELVAAAGPAPGAHGVAVAAVGDAVYAIGGATAAGHLGSTKEAEVLDLSG